jgi:hypothetical protein
MSVLYYVNLEQLYLKDMLYATIIIKMNDGTFQFCTSFFKQLFTMITFRILMERTQELSNVR